MTGDDKKQMRLDEVGTEEQTKNNDAINTALDEATLGKIPTDWESKRLEEVTEESLYGVAESAEDFDANNLRYIRITDISDDGILKGDDKKSLNINGIDKKYLLQPGQLLFARSGATVGKTYLYSDNDPKATYGGYLIRFIADTEQVNPQYLFYYTQSDNYDNWVTRVSRQGAQKNINAQEYSSILFPLPPLSEQRKIATVLYTVDRAMEKTEEIISQTQRVKQGIMDNVFEKGYYDHSRYDEVRIGPFIYEKPENWDICSIEESKRGENGLRRGPFGGMLKKEIFVDSGYKVYQQQNVIYDDFDYGDYYITDEKFRDMERFSVDAGDILISCSGTLGKVAVVPEEYKKGVINQALLKFTVEEEMFQTQYMKYFLESKIGQRQLVLSSRGSAMKNMAPMEFVRSAQIFEPPVDEQKKISQALISLDEKINAEKKKKENIKKLKRGLMQDLLSGTVRTTDTNIEVPEEIEQYG